MSNKNVKSLSMEEYAGFVLNGGVDNDGTFPTSAKEEMVANFTQGNTLGKLPLTVPFIAEVVFRFHTGESTNKAYVQGIDYVGDYRIIPVEGITCRTAYDGAESNLFIGGSRSEAGYKTFRYVGDYPLYTTLIGSLSWLRRMHATEKSTKAVQQILMIEPISGLPNVENSQNEGRQFFGISYASGDENFQLIAAEFTDNSNKYIDGWWVRKQFNICQTVEFYPGAEYAFRVREIAVGNGINPDAMNTKDRNLLIRMEAGGLSCLVDVSEKYRAKIEQFRVERYENSSGR